MLSRLLRSVFEFPSSLVWIFLAYSVWLWKYSVPFTGDEKVYLSIAMEMWHRHDWIIPWLMGEHSYFKPPLLYWATLSGWRIFGFGAVGAFFPSALATVGTAACVGLLSERALRTPRRAVLSPLWFAAAAGTITYGSTAQMEIWIVFFYSAAWLAALEFLSSRRGAFLFAALFCAGVLSLVKSPLYSALWVLGFWLYLALRREWAVFRELKFWSAHLLGIAVGVSWFALVFKIDRERFWSQYVMTETINKKGGNGSTALHMWADFTTFCLPFLLLAIPLAYAGARRALKFALAWCLLPAVFFSYFPYRTETYLYLLVPLIAVLMDSAASLRGIVATFAKWASRLNGAVGGAALVFLSWALARAGMIPTGLALALATCGGAAAIAAWRPGWKALAYAFLGAAFIVRLAAAALGELDIAGLRRELAEHPDRPIIFYDDSRYIWHEAGLLSVAIGKPAERALAQAELIPALRNGALLVLTDSQGESLMPELRRELGPDSSRLRVADWWRWKRGFQVPTLADLDRLGEQGNRRRYEIVHLEP